MGESDPQKNVPHIAAIAEMPQPVQPARMRTRHHAIVVSFLLICLLPVVLWGWYLWARAADQYASHMGFTVRSEEASTPTDILGGLAQLSTSASSDTDILYEFIQSQGMVRLVGAQHDLRAIWSAPGHDLSGDPIFALDPDATIEGLTDYWLRMVRVFYDPGTALLEVEVRAFDPQDAQNIANALFAQSSEMINQLTAIARADVTRYAEQDLVETQENLRAARQALTQFRNETRIVDVEADLQGQMGVVNSLQGQLAEALVEFDLIAGTAQSGDPRLVQTQRRIEVIQRRIDEERSKVGGAAPTPNGAAYADLVGQFESLLVDQEFAEEAYLSARAAYDATIAEARRQNRYLAAYEHPTLPEAPEYPRRPVLLGLAALLLFGTWSILVLVYYSLRDRR